MIQTSSMYIIECTCEYCDENHVVILGIYCNVSSEARENNVPQKNVLTILLLSAVAKLMYF